MSEEKKTKPTEKIIRTTMESDKDQYKSICEQVQKGEIKWMYYAVDGDKGYHHYITIK